MGENISKNDVSIKKVFKKELNRYGILYYGRHYTNEDLLHQQYVIARCVSII